LGFAAMLAALSGAAILFYGAINSFRVWLNTTRVIASLLQQSRPISKQGIALFEMPSSAPAFLVVGIIRPRLLASRRAVAGLDAKEFQAAVRHERVHVSNRDNLKKLSLC